MSHGVREKSSADTGLWARLSVDGRHHVPELKESILGGSAAGDDGDDDVEDLLRGILGTAERFS